MSAGDENLEAPQLSSYCSSAWIPYILRHNSTEAHECAEEQNAKLKGLSEGSRLALACDQQAV